MAVCYLVAGAVRRLKLTVLRSFSALMHDCVSSRIAAAMKRVLMVLPFSGSLHTAPT